jgi:L-seryl-tRNA(Ser) seleniumtransferase
MSGDKLLGGPQAGLLVGARDAVEACRRNPLARAFRVDKLTLAALEATLALYRDPGRAVRQVPALAMITAGADGLRARAVRLAGVLAARGVSAGVVETEGSVGGGAFPTARLPSWSVAITADAASTEEVLRGAAVPVIGRIAGDRFLLDLRSVPAELDARLAEAVTSALAAR